MSSFSDLKRASSSSFEALNQELSKINSKNDKSDDTRYWKPTPDKAGNGYAVIRFLPSPPKESVPFVKMFDYGFEGPGGWYIKNSPATIGREDPASEKFFELRKSSDPAEVELSKEMKRRMSFHSNIYVITDPAKPENEGKVFLYKYGKKIFDKLNDLMNPTFPGETPTNPFDLWAGANFQLKMRKVDGWVNYDKSVFEDAGPLFKDDDKMEEIWNQEYSLQEIISPDKFESYDKLKERLDKVLGLSATSASPAPSRQEAAEPKSLREAVAPKQQESSSNEGDEDEDEDFMSMFNKLKDE